MPQRFLSGMRTIASSRSGRTVEICIWTKRRVQRLRPFPCRKPGRPSLFYLTAYDDKTLFWLDVWITTRAAGRRDHRRLPPCPGVGAFIPGSMSGGQITPLVWSSRSLSVWLLRSCSVQAFESVFSAQADDPTARPINTTAKTFLLLPIFNKTAGKTRGSCLWRESRRISASRLSFLLMPCVQLHQERIAIRAAKSALTHKNSATFRALNHDQAY